MSCGARRRRVVGLPRDLHDLASSPTGSPRCSLASNWRVKSVSIDHHPLVSPKPRRFRAGRPRSRCATRRRMGRVLRSFEVSPSVDMGSGVLSQASVSRRAPFGARAATPVCSVRPRGFSPPRRFLPPNPRGLVASRCRPWGS